jgi:hypothetical protein
MTATGSELDGATAAEYRLSAMKPTRRIRR